MTVFVVMKYRYVISNIHTTETKEKERTKYVHVCVVIYVERKIIPAEKK